MNKYFRKKQFKKKSFWKRFSFNLFIFEQEMHKKALLVIALILVVVCLLSISFLEKDKIQIAEAASGVYTEDFSTDSYKDAINTTANWSTSESKVILGSASDKTAVSVTSPSYSTPTDIIWNASGNVYAISYTDFSGISYVIKTLNSAGVEQNVDTAPFSITNIATSGTEYGVVYYQPAPDVAYYRIYDSSLTPVTTAQITANPSNTKHPYIVWNGTEYGIFWSDDRDGNVEVYFARFDTAGNKLSGDIRITNAAADSDLVKVVWTGTEYGLLWTDYRDGNAEVYFASVDSTGSINVSDTRITNAPSYQDTPLHIDWTGTEYAIGWSSYIGPNTYRVYFNKIDTFGGKVLSDILVDSLFYGVMGADASGPCYCNSQFYMQLTEDGTYIDVVRLDTLGNILGTTTIATSVHPNMLINDGMACANGYVATIFTDSDNNLYFTRIDSAGDYGVAYAASSDVVSNKLNALGEINSAEITSVSETKPVGTDITYYLSRDGGVDWVEATPGGGPPTFNTTGDDLRWKAVLETTDQTVTPEITDIRIDFDYTGPAYLEYCVDKNASSPVCNDGTASANPLDSCSDVPFCSIQPAINAVPNNPSIAYVVTVYAGEYTESIAISGKNTSASNTITLQNHSGDRPIIDNNGTATGISIGSPYVTVKGFDITDINDKGIAFNTNNITIEDNWIHDNAVTIGAIRCDGAGAGSSTIHNNKLYNTNGGGFYNNCDNNIITENEIYGITGGAPLFNNGANSIIRENIVHNNTDGWPCVTINNANSTNILVENNICYEGSGGYQAESDASNVTFKNNLAYNCVADGIYIDSTTSNITIENNIFDSNGSGIKLASGNDSNLISASYNILYNNITALQMGTDYNSASSIDNASSKFSDNILVNPLYVNSADPDGADNDYWTADDGFLLQSSSPGLNAGDPADDYSNEPEDNGDRINIGAYGNTGYASVSANIAPEINDKPILTDLGNGNFDVEFNLIDQNGCTTCQIPGNQDDYPAGLQFSLNGADWYYSRNITGNQNLTGDADGETYHLTWSIVDDLPYESGNVYVRLRPIDEWLMAENWSPASDPTAFDTTVYPATYHVDINDSDCDDSTGIPVYCHIQNAVNDVPSPRGQVFTINVHPGVYSESVSLTGKLGDNVNTLTIQADPSATLGDVEVDGCFEGSTMGTPDCSHIIISGFEIYNSFSWIESDNITIQNCLVHDESILLRGTDCKIINNIIYDYGDVRIQWGDNGIIANNIMHDAGVDCVAIGASGGSNYQVYNNIFYNCTNNGINIEGGTAGNHIIKNNIIYNAIDPGTLSAGIWGTGENLEIINNTIYNFDIGILAHTGVLSNPNTVKNNIIADCGLGLMVADPGWGPSYSNFSYNQLYNNTMQVAMTPDLVSFEEANEAFRIDEATYSSSTFNNIFIADPQFADATDPDGADNIFWTADDGLIPQSGSASLNAGDPTSTYVNEPDPNGDRINLGAYGNTSLATESANQAPSILSVPGEPLITDNGDGTVDVTFTLVDPEGYMGCQIPKPYDYPAGLQYSIDGGITWHYTRSLGENIELTGTPGGTQHTIKWYMYYDLNKQAGNVRVRLRPIDQTLMALEWSDQSADFAFDTNAYSSVFNVDNADPNCDDITGIPYYCKIRSAVDAVPDNIASSGDSFIINIYKSTYNDSEFVELKDMVGSASNTLTIQANPGNCESNSCDSVLVDNGSFYNTDTHQGEYIKIDGLDITNTADSCIYNIGENVVIKNNIIHDCNSHGIGFEDEDNLTVTNNTIYNCGEDGIGGTGHDSIISGNTIYNNGRDGIAFFHDNVQIYENKIYNNRIGIAQGIGSDAMIKNNIVYNNIAGIYCSVFGSSNSRILNNAVYKNECFGILTTGTDAANPNIVKNNIISNNNQSACTLGDLNNENMGGLVIFDASVADTYNIISYNLFYNNGLSGTQHVSAVDGSAHPTSTYLNPIEIENISITNNNFDHAFIDNPDFKDVDGADNTLGYSGGVNYGCDDDFTLLADSPGVNAGDPADDYSNEPIPNGNRINLGAYGNLGNTVIGAPCATQVYGYAQISTNEPPVVTNMSSSGSTGDIIINFDLADPNGDTCNVSSGLGWGLWYSTDNIAWSQATVSNATNKTPGTGRSVTWQSSADLAFVGTVYLKLKANDGSLSSDEWADHSLSIDNRIIIREGTCTTGISNVYLGDTICIYVADSAISGAGTTDIGITTTSGDNEVLTLPEIAPGVFQNTINTTSGAAIGSDGTLQGVNNDLITAQSLTEGYWVNATAIAKVSVRSSNCSNVLSVVNLDSPICIYQDDSSLAGNGTTDFQVTTPTDTENYTLVEDPAGSGIFYLPDIPTSSEAGSDSDGTINAINGDTITVTFTPPAAGLTTINDFETYTDTTDLNTEWANILSSASIILGNQDANLLVEHESGDNGMGAATQKVLDPVIDFSGKEFKFEIKLDPVVFHATGIPVGPPHNFINDFVIVFISGAMDASYVQLDSSNFSNSPTNWDTITIENADLSVLNVGGVTSGNPVDLGNVSILWFLTITGDGASSTDIDVRFDNLRYGTAVDGYRSIDNFSSYADSAEMTDGSIGRWSDIWGGDTPTLEILSADQVLYTDITGADTEQGTALMHGISTPNINNQNLYFSMYLDSPNFLNSTGHSDLIIQLQNFNILVEDSTGGVSYYEMDSSQLNSGWNNYSVFMNNANLGDFAPLAPAADLTDIIRIYFASITGQGTGSGTGEELNMMINDIEYGAPPLAGYYTTIDASGVSPTRCTELTPISPTDIDLEYIPTGPGTYLIRLTWGGYSGNMVNIARNYYTPNPDLDVLSPLTSIASPISEYIDSNNIISGTTYRYLFQAANTCGEVDPTGTEVSIYVPAYGEPAININLGVRINR